MNVGVSQHLNTPRLVADATGTTVWRWDQAEPFGNSPANEDPDANSIAFDLPLRLPGQRYDSETALHYNFYRDYDPTLGRFVQSDPVGIAGGLHMFGYVNGRPMVAIDVDGLAGSHPQDGLDPLIACKMISKDPKPDICVDEQKCFEKTFKALNKCNATYWSYQKKWACVTCWKYIEGLCPGLTPGPECKNACRRPLWSDVPEIEV